MRARVSPTLLAALVGLSLAGAPASFALEEYAARTGQPCLTCHQSASGGALTAAGEGYQADPEAWVAPPPAPPLPPVLRYLRLLALFLHIAFAVVWMGTILYVHIVLKPAYALGGLPRNEVGLAKASIPALLATGAFLTWVLHSSDPMLFHSRFGAILLAKVAIFLVMVGTAVFATRVLSPRLRALSRGKPALEARAAGQSLTPAQLRGCDGKEGRPA